MLKRELDLFTATRSPKWAVIRLMAYLMPYWVTIARTGAVSLFDALLTEEDLKNERIEIY